MTGTKRHFVEKASKTRLDLAAGRVTALEPQAKHPNRLNLYVDNHFALGLSILVASRVRVGQEVSTDELQALARSDETESAHERALSYLTVRPRSEREMRRYLAGKQFNPIIVDQVILRLTEARLLSDRDFARFWVENRDSFKPRSARALKYELRQKGVPPEEITRAVKQRNEAETAYRAARGRAERWKELDAPAFREKLSGFLARRGFDYAVTRDTVNKIWKEVHGQEAADVELID